MNQEEEHIARRNREWSRATREAMGFPPPTQLPMPSDEITRAFLDVTIKQARLGDPEE